MFYAVIVSLLLAWWTPAPRHQGYILDKPSHRAPTFERYEPQLHACFYRVHGGQAVRVCGASGRRP